MGPAKAPRRQLVRIQCPDNAALEPALRGALGPGERIMWMGRPRRRLDWAPLLLWLFAVPWTGFALFWTYSAWSMTTRDPRAGLLEQGVGLLFPAFGLPFVVVGLALVAAPLFAITVPARTLNAITDRRVLRLVSGRFASLRTIPCEAIRDYEIASDPDGSGTVRLWLARWALRPARGNRGGRRMGDTTQWSMRAVPFVRDAGRALERLRINCGSSTPNEGRDR